MSREAILAYQERELSDLLSYVVDNVPFYRKYRSAVARLKPCDALKEFPLMTKLDVREHLGELTASSNIPHHQARTSGSSGNQLTFYEDDTTYSREMGYMHSQWQRVGYSPHCRKAMFRDIPFRQKMRGIYWQANPIHNELQFSIFHMSEVNLPLYLERLIQYKPHFLHGYPSAIDVLAEYILRVDGAKLLPPIKCALLGSEGCSAMQRERISQAFRTRIFTWYGHSERTVLGGECECSDYYHHFPGYGVLEIVKSDGSPVACDEEGEIVGTGFLNRFMPLVRYRTDDYAVRRTYVCECSRKWDRFSNVIGRRDTDGYVIGKSGRRFPLVMLETPSRAFRNVIRFQYYQRKCGELHIRMMVNANFLQGEERMIIEEHRKRFLDEMDLFAEHVRDIPLTPAGKQRWIVSEIDPQKP
jgi:phenylacetate-CoA ligase